MVKRNIIETHAHIYDEAFLENRLEMLNRAKLAGITEIWMPNCNSETLGPMIELASEFPDFCLPMIGLHPCYVKDDFEKELQIVENEILKRKPLAIGEIGLDLFWDKTFYELQQEAFIFQSNLAIKHNLWIDIQSRHAFWETVDLIEKIGDKRLKGIFHCFVGNEDEAKKAIELGFLLGIGGVSTFKNGGLDKILPNIDLKHIVLETDSPYLAPVPHRGKRNEPSYLELIVQKIAGFYSTSVENICQITTENALILKANFS
jgi:TatD DNase family protein